MEDLIKKIENSGLKKKWIAEKLEIPQSTLSSYINGTRTMPEHIFKELNTILN